MLRTICLLSLLLTPRVGLADTIYITGGTLTADTNWVNLSLMGTRGFSTFVHTYGDVFGIWSFGPDSCLRCEQDDPASLWLSRSSGSEFNANFSLDGGSYSEPMPPALNPLAGFNFQFSGMAHGTKPSMSGSFLFSGNVRHRPDLLTPWTIHTVSGHGTAALVYEPIPYLEAMFPGQYWQFASATYTFADATPIVSPEPGSLILLTTGLAALFRRRRNLRTHPNP